MKALLSFLREDLATVIGWTLVHSIWQGCLLGLLLAFALSRVPDSSSRLRYQLSLTALFALFCAVVITFIYQLPGQGQEQHIALNPALPFQAGVSASQPVETWSKQWMVQWIEDHSLWLAVLWMVGLVFSFLRLGINLRYTAYLRKHYTYALPKEWNDYFKSMLERYGISKPVQWMESALVSSPVLLGHIKPLILFPIGLVNQLSPRETEAILAHELTHIANCDYLVNVCQSVVEALLYYHPVVWWISQRIRDTREQRCDDRVVGAICDPLTYAKALTKTEAFLNGPKPALALSATDTKYKLLHRMQRVLIPSSNPVTPMERRTFIILLLTLVGALILHVETSYASKSALSWLPDLGQIKNWVWTDTIPEKPKDKPKNLNVQIDNGEIKKLVVDGKEIPKEKYGEYDYLIAPPPPPAERLEGLEDLAPLPPMPDFPDLPEMPDLNIGEFKVIYGDSLSYYGHGDNQHYIYGGKNGVYWTQGPFTVPGEMDSLVKLQEGVYVYRGPGVAAYGTSPQEIEKYKRLAEKYARDSENYAREIEKKYGDKAKWRSTADEYARQARDYARQAEEIARRVTRERQLKRNEAYGYSYKLSREEQAKVRKEQEKARKAAQKARESQDRLLLEFGNPEGWASYYSYDLPSVNGMAYVPMEGGDQSAFERQLLSDGLIEDASNYSFELSYERMKVNGKKQKSETLENYKKHYKRFSGKSLGKSDKISIIKRSDD